MAPDAASAIIDCMASITIRDLDDRLKARLRVRAAENGRAMEEEVRVILRTVLSTDEPAPRRLGDTIRARFEPLGGVDLELPPRTAMRAPPRFK